MVNGSLDKFIKPKISVATSMDFLKDKPKFFKENDEKVLDNKLKHKFDQLLDKINLEKKFKNKIEPKEKEYQRKSFIIKKENKEINNNINKNDIKLITLKNEDDQILSRIISQKSNTHTENEDLYSHNLVYSLNNPITKNDTSENKLTHTHNDIVNKSEHSEINNKSQNNKIIESPSKSLPKINEKLQFSEKSNITNIEKDLSKDSKKIKPSWKKSNNNDFFLTNLLEMDQNIEYPQNKENEQYKEKDSIDVKELESIKKEEEKLKLLDIQNEKQKKLSIFQVGRVNKNSSLRKVNPEDYSSFKRVQSFCAENIKSLSRSPSIFLNNSLHKNKLFSQKTKEDENHMANITLLPLLSDNINKIDDIDKQIQDQIQKAKMHIGRSESQIINSSKELFKSLEFEKMNDLGIIPKNRRSTEMNKIIDTDNMLEGFSIANSNSNLNVDEDYKLFDKDILNGLKNKLVIDRENLKDKNKEKLNKIYKVDADFLKEKFNVMSQKHLDLEHYQASLVELIRDRVGKEELREFLIGLKNIINLSNSVKKVEFKKSEREELTTKTLEAKVILKLRKEKNIFEDWLNSLSKEEREEYDLQQKNMELEDLKKGIKPKKQNLKIEEEEEEETDKKSQEKLVKKRCKSQWQMTYDKVRDILPDIVVEKIKSIM